MIRRAPGSLSYKLSSPDQAIGNDAIFQDVPGTIADQAGQFPPEPAPSRLWPSLRKEWPA
jgi:hypothetical protein